MGANLEVPSSAHSIPPGNDQRLTKAVEETFNFKLSGLSGIALPESWKRLGSVSVSTPLRKMLQPFL